MPKIFRPQRPSKLDPLLLKEKIRKDTEYEFAVRELYATLPRPQAQIEKAKLWQAYENWAKLSGIYEEISLEEQLNEAMLSLTNQLKLVNELRAEAGVIPPLKIGD